MHQIVESKITGTQVAYYLVCKRKLWLFTHHIDMERESDLVALGKLISEESFKRERWKEVEIGDTLKIDFMKIGDEVVVHEVKKSRALEEAHIWQVKFYIYRLRKLGINSSRGIIHYPKLFRKIDVEWKEDDERKIESALREIDEIKTRDFPPPPVRASRCRKCAYYQFCFI